MDKIKQNAKTRSGDINQTNLYIEDKRTLSKTIIYNLLQIISDSNIESNNDYSLALPARIDKKLVFNGAFRYKNIFVDYSGMLASFSQVIEDFADSEKIVSKVHHIFLFYVPLHKDGQPKAAEGDKQLGKIKNKLLTIIKSDYRYQGNYYDEQIESFVYTIMLYCVEKCKILINPNETSNWNDSIR